MRRRYPLASHLCGGLGCCLNSLRPFPISEAGAGRKLVAHAWYYSSTKFPAVSGSLERLAVQLSPNGQATNVTKLIPTQAGG